MPEKATMDRARRAKRAGKPPTTQAGAFVREEMEHMRRRKHGAESREQAIAIGLSNARRSGIELPPRRKGKQQESSGNGRRKRSQSRERKAS